jgi:hypothetical protein
MNSVTRIPKSLQYSFSKHEEEVEERPVICIRRWHPEFSRVSCRNEHPNASCFRPYIFPLMRQTTNKAQELWREKHKTNKLPIFIKSACRARNRRTRGLVTDGSLTDRWSERPQYRVNI